MDTINLIKEATTLIPMVYDILNSNKKSNTIPNNTITTFKPGNIVVPEPKPNINVTVNINIYYGRKQIAGTRYEDQY